MTRRTDPSDRPPSPAHRPESAAPRGAVRADLPGPWSTVDHGPVFRPRLAWSTVDQGRSRPPAGCVLRPPCATKRSQWGSGQAGDSGGPAGVILAPWSTVDHPSRALAFRPRMGDHGSTDARPAANPAAGGRGTDTGGTADRKEPEMRLSWGMSWTRSAALAAAWWAVPVAVGLLINAAISRSLPADAPEAPITPLENHAELFFSAVMVVVPIVLPPAAAYVHRSWKVLVVMIALPVLFAVGTAVVFLLALSSGGGHPG